MKLAPAVQQAIDVFARTEQTKADIATAIMAKQMDSDKQQGAAVLQLLEQAKVPQSPARGLDVRA